MSETIKIEVEGIGEFKFKALPGFADEQRIRSEMANTLKRGYEELMELDAAINSAHERHKKANEELYGKEEANKMFNRYYELLKVINEKNNEDARKEYEELSEKLVNNRHFQLFIELNKHKIFLEDYSRLKVLCISKPKDFEFENAGSEKQLKILSAYKEKKKELEA